MTSEGDKRPSKIESVSMVGLGKLGAPFAAAIASKGFPVAGVDTNPDTVRLINEGRAPVYEPGLEELLSSCLDKLRATDDIEAAVRETDATFIVVPTPSDQQGAFSVERVLRACEKVGNAIKHKAGFHLVVLTSTVLPGATGGEVKTALERHSGEECGQGFGLCYSPEFIALGSVIRDFLNPDFILIGESDPRSGKLLESFYKRVCENDPPVARMNLINAELTKISLNSYVTMKITFANMLARICERTPGADVDVVTGALGLDSRIGGKYLKGSIGYGGPCFPRDNKAFSCFAEKIGASSALAQTTDAINRQQVNELARIIKQRLGNRNRVAVLGLAYKPDTNAAEDSQAVGLVTLLAEKGFKVTVYDPAAMENASKEMENSATFAASTEECVRGADLIVITTPWREFKDIEPAWLETAPSRPVIIDCWRILEAARYAEVADYVTLGTGPCKTGCMVE